jgi:hypothetical protein
MKSYKAEGTLKVLESKSVAGTPGCLFTFPTLAQRRNFYVELIFADRWVELHYSAPDGGKSIDLGRQSLEPIVASLKGKPYDSAPGELLEADITNAEIGLIEQGQGCSAKSKDYICRAIAAFRLGGRPSGRRKPIGLAGVGTVLFFDRSMAGMTDAIGMPEATTLLLVISDTEVQRGSFGKLTKEQQKADKELIGAIKGGKPIDGNPLISIAKSATETRPAALAERSMIMPGTRKLYLRETSIGVIGLGLVAAPNGAPLGAILEVYPTQ